MTPLRQRMLEELQRRNYSSATIRGYNLAVKQFAEYFGKPPDRLGATHVKRFPVVLVAGKKTRSWHSRDANVGVAILLQEDAQAARHAFRRPSIPQKAAKATHGSEP